MYPQLVFDVAPRSSASHTQSLVYPPTRPWCIPSLALRSLVYPPTRPWCIPSLALRSLVYPPTRPWCIPSLALRSLVYPPTRPWCIPSLALRSLVYPPHSSASHTQLVFGVYPCATYLSYTVNEAWARNKQETARLKTRPGRTDSSVSISYSTVFAQTPKPVVNR